MTNALMELAEHIDLLTKVRDASKANGGVRRIDFGKESGDAFIAALTTAIEALQLRTAAAEGEEAVGVLDRSMPPKIWLQIDPNGDEEHRNYPVDQSSWSEISWCAESVGGQEVLYIRNDLARTSPPTDSGAGQDGVRLAAVLRDVRWRISDTRETLMADRICGEGKLYGCDEWSTPTVNLQRAIVVIDKAIGEAE